MQLKKGVPYKETIFLPSPQKNSKVSVPRKWVSGDCVLGEECVLGEGKKMAFVISKTIKTMIFYDINMENQYII
jgi:hypothetical protein